jgi:hypothetical protein
MAIASITSWLEGSNRNYQHGLLLYEQYGTNPVILALLKSGSGSYHLSKLIIALEALNKQTDLVPKPIVFEEYVAEPTTIHGKEQFDYASAPDKIIEIRDNKNKEYALARKKHEAIRVMDDQQHRLQLGLEILDHMDTVETSWSVIDLWTESGEVRKMEESNTEQDISTLSLAMLSKEENNLKSYISKDKKRLKEATTDKNKVKISQRLDLRNKRLALVRERLKNELI